MHTLHIHFFNLKKMMMVMEKEERLICGEDNQAFFRQKLREYLPGLLPELKALYDAGMIQGLRGTVLTINPAEKTAETPKADDPACGDCRHFIRDSIGFGEGLGQCALKLRPSILKWPGTQACCGKFEAVA